MQSTVRLVQCFVGRMPGADLDESGRKRWKMEIQGSAKMSKRERLHEALHIAEILCSDDAGITSAELRGLLKVCDAYIETEAELSFLKESGEWEWHRERAREKLEEMLG